MLQTRPDDELPSLDAERFAAMLGPWHDAGGGTTRQRLTLAIRHLLTTGLVPTGTALPPERALAVALGVSRPTVSAAIADLRGFGLIESRQGSGSRVAGPSGAVRSMIDLATATPFDATHLGSLVVDTTGLLAVTPSTGIDSAGVGLDGLRTAVARWRTRRGRPTAPDHVVITGGAHHGLALAIAARVPAGGTIAVEATTYGPLVELAAAARASLVVIRRDARGIDPADLDHVLATHRPDLVALVGLIHAPSGTAAGSERLDRIAEVLDRHGIPTVIDGALDDLAFGPLAGHLERRCRTTEVISIGTLSKSAWAGLGIGWIVNDPDARRSPAIGGPDVRLGGPSVVAQVMAERLLERFDDVLEPRVARLHRTSDSVLAWLGEAVPEWVPTRPDGGLSLWIRLPTADAAPFVEALARAGVGLGTGSTSRVDRQPDPHVRMCVDRPDYVLDEALDRMVDIWKAGRW